jgi:hypothetical protein
LYGKGVSSIDEALKEMDLLPLHSRYENFFSYDNLEKIRTYLVHKPDKNKKDEVVALPGKMDKELDSLVAEFSKYFDGKISSDKVKKNFQDDLSNTRIFFQLWISQNNRKNAAKWLKACDNILPVNSMVETKREYLTLINIILLKQIFSKKSDMEKIHVVFDELLLIKPITNIFQNQINGSSIHQRTELIKVLLSVFLLEKKKPVKSADVKKTKMTVKTDTSKNDFTSSIKVLLAENSIHNLLRINEFEGITYFNKEHFEELVKWILMLHLIVLPSTLKNKEEDTAKLKKTALEKEIIKNAKDNFEKFTELITKADAGGYDFNKFNIELKKSVPVKVKTKTITKKRKKI